MVTTRVISSDLKAARGIQQEVLQELAGHGYTDSSTFAIRLALEEGLNNAIRHGNGYDPEKTVEVTYDVDDDRVAISITDEGPGFRPGDVPDPRLDENVVKPCGRGIMLIRAYMDEVRYNDVGNQVRMVKRRG